MRFFHFAYLIHLMYFNYYYLDQIMCFYYFQKKWMVYSCFFLLIIFQIHLNHLKEALLNTLLTFFLIHRFQIISMAYLLKQYRLLHIVIIIAYELFSFLYTLLQPFLIIIYNLKLHQLKFVIWIILICSLLLISTKGHNQ